MMVVIYTGMLLALVLAWRRYEKSAVVFFTLTFILSFAWFLYHIYTPDTGFNMPWLQF